MKKIKTNAHIILKYTVLAILLVTLAYVIYRIAITTFSKNGSAPWLMFWQCIVGIVMLFIPDFCNKKFKWQIPQFLAIFYIILLFCSVYLGEIWSFYYNFRIFGYRIWDIMLHLSYSALLVTLGFSIIGFLNRAENVKLKFSPFWVVAFSFFFAITVDMLWELFEFTMDSCFGFNMQKYMDAEGVEFVGQAALLDTMKDMIVDFTGALSMCVFSYISVKRHGDFLDKILIKREGDTGNAVEEMISEK